MYKEIFKVRLRHARNMMGFSQQQIADQLDVNRTTYTNWENGNREPDIETLGKLCEILETDLNWLIGTQGMSFDKKTNNTKNLKM